ncbi:MAG: peptide ABC transporter substrate-binding protein [Bdellovibrionota bacterium]
MSQNETPVFRFHMPAEPHSLDPARLQSTDASFFFNNVMRGLFSYSNEKGLVPEGAKSCEFVSRLKLECKLDKSVKWSDGSRVVAADYVRAFKHLLSPTTKSSVVELLKNVKNAMAAHGGTVPVEQVGIRVANDGTLIFDFEKHDPDFLYKLTASPLVPAKSDSYPERDVAEKLVVNGPYKIVSWKTGRRVRLESNPHYARGETSRPPVEILFVDEDETAYNLYRKGELTFLRRLPTTNIPAAKGQSDFFQKPVSRFDYLGFGLELKDQPDLRAALSLSLDFKELQKIYDALGIPGCPSLPEEWMDRARCVKFDLAKAKEHFAKVPAAVRTKPLRLVFSTAGGDDIKKGAEWLQAQWKKNLGFEVRIEGTENGIFLGMLRSEAPPIFRKGVGLERPTCLAALETFSSEGSENFIRLRDPAYEKIVSRMQAVSNRTAKAKLCGEGVQFLLDRNLLVPLGRIHFTMLARPTFVDWSLNEMNQLDLSSLRSVSDPAAKRR